MGNVLKAVATGGLSLLPGKAGKIASAIGTGGASLLPGKAGRIAGGLMGDPTAIFGGGGYGKGAVARAVNPANPTAPTPLGVEKAMPAGAGLVSQMVNPNMGAANAAGNSLRGAFANAVANNPAINAQPQETPRQRAERQAAQKAARGNQKLQAQVNPAEVPNRRPVSGMILNG